MNSLQTKIFTFGVLQTILMSIYHFFIPLQFGWEDYLLNNSPTINWSLISLNNYFSFNLLTESLILWYLIKRKSEAIKTIEVLGLVLLLFWLFSLIYQLIYPMPLPKRFMFLSVLLPAIAFLNILLIGIPLWSSFRKQGLTL